MKTLNNIIEFFSKNNIPMVSVHGIENGICTCKAGMMCGSPGKHPNNWNWKKNATLSSEEMMKILEKNKNINIGIRTGIFNPQNNKYLVIVDLDQINHPFENKLNQEEKNTLCQLTGSGGKHYFFWSNKPIKNSVSLMENKVDIRGTGGLAVIAPSKHYSGQNYRFLSENFIIKDLPKFIEDRLNELTDIKQIKVSKKDLELIKKISKENINGNKMKDNFQKNPWVDLTIKELRKKLKERKELVPAGIRNNIMHRILSSDRAIGVSDKNQLFKNAMGYLKSFSDIKTFGVKEIEKIVNSVMFYPAYNNSFEKVNTCYMEWLKKKKIPSSYSIEVLEKLDSEFFNCFEPTSGKKPKIESLSFVADCREYFLKLNGLKRFSIYRPQLLGNKLTSLGYKKKKTNKSNFWVLTLKKEYEFLREEVEKMRANKLKEEQDKLNKMNEKTQNTSTDVSVETKDASRDELILDDSESDEEIKKSLKDGDIFDYHGKKTRISIITTKAKVRTHSREHLYRGRTGYDYNVALRKLLSRMTEEQMDLFSENNLIMNEDYTKEWASYIKSGDIIGVKNNRYQIKDKREKDFITASIVTASYKDAPGEFETSDDLVELSLSQVDHARELELLDLLWREGKPFGEKFEEEYKVYFLTDLEEEEQEAKEKLKQQEENNK